MIRSLVRGSAALAIADFSKKALLAVTVLLCARTVPKAVFGNYMFLMSFYQIFSVMAGSGVPNILIRDVARHREWMPDHAVASVSVRLMYAVPAVALMIGFFFLGGYSRQLFLPLLSLGLLMVFRAATENAIALFQGREDVVSCAAISVVQSAVTVAATAYVCFTTKSLLYLVLCHTAGAVCSTLFALYRFHARRLELLSGIRGSFATTKAFFQATAWNNGATLVSSAYNRCDVLLLQRLATAEAVATYSAPYRLLDLAQIIPTSVMGMMMPRLSRALAAEDSPVDQSPLISTLLVMALLFVIVASLLAPWVVPLILGRPYANSVLVVQVLVWAIPFMFFNYVLLANFIVTHVERFLFLTSFLALLVNLGTNALLIPLFSYKAAAGTTVLTEAFLLGVNAYFCRRSGIRFRPAWMWNLAVSYAICATAAVLWVNPSNEFRALGALLFVVSLSPIAVPMRSLLTTTPNELAVVS